MGFWDKAKSIGGGALSVTSLGITDELGITDGPFGESIGTTLVRNLDPTNPEGGLGGLINPGYGAAKKNRQATERGLNNIQFNPVNVSTGIASSQYDPNTGYSTSMSEPYANLLSQYQQGAIPAEYQQDSRLGDLSNRMYNSAINPMPGMSYEQQLGLERMAQLGGPAGTIQGPQAGMMPMQGQAIAGPNVSMLPTVGGQINVASSGSLPGVPGQIAGPQAGRMPNASPLVNAPSAGTEMPSLYDRQQLPGAVNLSSPSMSQAQQGMFNSSVQGPNTNIANLQKEQYANLRAMAEPAQSQARTSQENRLMAQGRLGSTGGAKEMEALSRAQGQQDLGMMQQAFGQAQGVAGLDLQRFQTESGQELSRQQSQAGQEFQRELAAGQFGLQGQAQALQQQNQLANQNLGLGQLDVSRYGAELGGQGQLFQQGMQNAGFRQGQLDNQFNQNMQRQQLGFNQGLASSQFGLGQANQLFNQGLARQGQQYNQNMGLARFGLDQQGQRFNQGLQNAQVGFNQDLDRAGFGLQQQAQRFNQGLAAQGQDFNQQLAGSQFGLQQNAQQMNAANNLFTMGEMQRQINSPERQMALQSGAAQGLMDLGRYDTSQQMANQQMGLNNLRAATGLEQAALQPMQISNQLTQQQYDRDMQKFGILNQAQIAQNNAAMGNKLFMRDLGMGMLTGGLSMPNFNFSNPLFSGGAANMTIPGSQQSNMLNDQWSGGGF